MLEKYDIDDSKLLKIAVVATMSSGKSTFINALIGQDILPSQNQACTAKIIPILDNDKSNGYKAYVEYNDGKNEVLDLKDKEVIDSFNNKNEIKEILIEGNIENIRNRNKAVVLVDTPGTNFSGDDTHQEETYRFITNLKEGLILYVINATQFGIDDDSELMNYIKEKIKESDNKLKILFVVNKLDEFDSEKENIEQTMNSIYEYIVSNGIKNPKVIPISALAAKLFRQVINKQELTRKEIRDFKDYYDLFKPIGCNLNKFSKLDGTEKKQMDIGGKTFYEDDLLIAIENTGIVLVEKTIEDLLIDENSIYIPKVNFDENQDDCDIDIDVDIDDIIQNLLDIYKDIDILDDVKEIKSYTNCNKISYYTFMKVYGICTDALVSNMDALLDIFKNEGKNNYDIPKIVRNAIKEIKKIIREDNNNLEI